MDEANKLRQEAKDLLNAQLLSMMGISSGQTIFIVSINRVVDCIIGAAVLETSAMLARAMERGE